MNTSKWPYLKEDIFRFTDVLNCSTFGFLTTTTEEPMEVRLDARQVALPSRSRDVLARRIVRLFGRLTSSISRVHITLKNVDGARGDANRIQVSFIFALP